MALNKEVYRELEDILGPENIADDPAILDSYAWRSGLVAGLEKFVPRFEAVTLPKDTAEVQAIIKLCNKHGIQFKASSTGWGCYCDHTGPGVIKIDLRRMNRIIEINEKNIIDAQTELTAVFLDPEEEMTLVIEWITTETSALILHYLDLEFTFLDITVYSHRMDLGIVTQASSSATQTLILDLGPILKPGGVNLVSGV